MILSVHGYLVNPLKTDFNRIFIDKTFSLYRSVNTHHLRYKNQSVPCSEIILPLFVLIGLYETNAGTRSYKLSCWTVLLRHMLCHHLYNVIGFMLSITLMRTVDILIVPTVGENIFCLYVNEPFLNSISKSMTATLP